MQLAAEVKEQETVSRKKQLLFKNQLNESAVFFIYLVLFVLAEVATPISSAVSFTVKVTSSAVA